jgi:ribonucleoside-triphosphate reductase (thioredoxin)
MDSREGWADALRQLLERHWRAPNSTLVLDLSLLRARGAPIRTFGGRSAGPLPLAALLRKVNGFLNRRVGRQISSLDAMLIDHWIAEAVAAGNLRRSARMSIKHWRDDDIGEFLSAKKDPIAHWSTNISVEVDDAFFAQLGTADPAADAVLDAAVEGMIRNGEPGLWNRSLSQVGERGDVVCTNPCGEIALEEWENCNLGHVNLSAFVDDFDGALEAHRIMTRFLLRATFSDVPDPRQRMVLDRNRRIGVGHFGFQAWLVGHGVRYSEAATRPWIRETLTRFAAMVRNEADRYACELGVSSPVKVTTVAPTGTIAKLAGATEGIQPIYARYFIRRVRFADNDPEVASLRAAGFDVAPDIYSNRTLVASLPTQDSLVAAAQLRGAADLVESADELDLETLLETQAMYQQSYADNAVSMTVNLPAGRVPPSRLRKALIQFLPQLKGTTVMVDESRPQAPYERITQEEYESSEPRSVDDSPASCAGYACPIGNEGEH